MVYFRNALGLLLGLVAGGIVNMGLVLAGPGIIPPPEGVDVTDAQSIAASMHLFEPRHFLFPFLAHAVGTFCGALLAVVIAATRRGLIAVLVGVFFLFGGISAANMIPAPTWFTVCDLLFAYLPMAGLAWVLGQGLLPESGARGEPTH